MLPEIENRSRKRRQLNRENEDIENRLRRLSAGATVEAFVAEAEFDRAGQPCSGNGTTGG